MEKSMVSEHVRKRRKHITLTFALLLIAALETWHLNCNASLTFWCPFTFLYLALSIPVVFVLLYYR